MDFSVSTRLSMNSPLSMKLKMNACFLLVPPNCIMISLIIEEPGDHTTPHVFHCHFACYRRIHRYLENEFTSEIRKEEQLIANKIS